MQENKFKFSNCKNFFDNSVVFKNLFIKNLEKENFLMEMSNKTW